MTAKVQRTEQGLTVMISPEMSEALALQEGTEVEITPVRRAPSSLGSNADVLRGYAETLPQREDVYRTLAESEQSEITAEEALATYQETLPEHEEAYRALAK